MANEFNKTFDIYDYNYFILNKQMEPSLSICVALKFNNGWVTPEITGNRTYLCVLRFLMNFF